MKKLSKILLVLALTVTVYQPCKTCKYLEKNGTAEELEQHIQEVHNGINPNRIDGPNED